MIINGKKISEKILSKVKQEIGEKQLKLKLAVILVGDDKSSKIYIKKKKEASRLVGIDFENMVMVIYGTRYAGEMKKGILTLMMYLMPLKGHLTLHSSANVGQNGSATMFFGLSGTGKTTLSADPDRYLIGDDEHVWTEDNIYNIEGGCYAKCINLSREKEPDIYDAIKYGAVLENVIHYDGVVDYADTSITENTRCSYPLSHIPNAIIPAIGHIPDEIIFLTCDATGVLPPIAKLSIEQAKYFFVSGYTSKVAGTEMGIVSPIATFSSSFGEAFLVWHPLMYGNLLGNKLLNSGCNVWLLNTGWIGGGYKDGKRIPLRYSRQMVAYINDKKYLNDRFSKYSIFEFDVPLNVGNQMVLDNNDILFPIKSFPSKEEYNNKITELHEKFRLNLKDKLGIFIDIV